MPKIDLFLDKSVEQNAGLYFDKAKKLKKKAQGAREALVIHRKKLEELQRKKEKEKEAFERKRSQVPAKKEWYEKFRWFLSSEGFLVIGGRDATTNEMVIKKHTDSSDLVFHTDISGSPFFVVKAEGKEIGEATIRETADATVTFSRVFQLGHSNSPVFHVSPDQVSKEAQSGEYLTKGAFMIRGKTTYVDNSINLAIGKMKDGRLMAAPKEAVKAHCQEFLLLEQGDEKSSAVAKKIQKKLGGSLDDIIRILPTGGMRINAKAQSLSNSLSRNPS